jgi:hypothetical protein
MPRRDHHLLAGQVLGQSAPAHLERLDPGAPGPHRPLLGGADVRFQVLQPERELVGVELLRPCAVAGALELRDLELQGFDLAPHLGVGGLGRLERAGQIAHEPGQEVGVARQVGEVQAHGRA